MASLARSAVLCFTGKHCQCTAYTSIHKEVLSLNFSLSCSCPG